MHAALVHRDIHYVTRGGICTLYRSLSDQLARRGVQVSVITQQSPDPIRIDGVHLHVLPRTEDLNAHRAAVASVLDRIGPDIVECSTWEAEALTYLDRPARAPVLVRGEFSAARLGAHDLAIDELGLVRRADRVIAVSDWAARDLAAAYAIPTPATVHNGVNIELFRPGPPTVPRSGFHVRLDRHGQPAQREPLRELIASGVTVPPWTTDPAGRIRLVWVGKITPMKGWDRLERVVSAVRETATVTVLLGHSPRISRFTIDPALVTLVQDLDGQDVAGLYRRADWLLSTSRWEGFGLAIAEAMATGTPALLPMSLGTAPELLAAGGGLTYDDIDHLRRILRTGNKPTGRIPADFSWSANADTTITHYLELVAGGRRR